MPIIGNNIDEAARRLCNGQPVAFATETVYGLGAAANNRQAMSTMYALKNRPSTHPSIVHLADFADADQWAHVSPTARQLAAAFMPGALTLLLPARTSCIAAAKHNTVALRVPAHPQARALLAAAAIGIAAPSANRFGRLSPTTAAHVCAEFPQEQDLYILDGGNCAIGVESTIVSCLHGQVSLIRPGAIVAKQIAEVAEVALVAAAAAHCRAGNFVHTLCAAKTADFSQRDDGGNGNHGGIIALSSAANCCRHVGDICRPPRQLLRANCMPICGRWMQPPPNRLLLKCRRNYHVGRRCEIGCCGRRGGDKRELNGVIFPARC